MADDELSVTTHVGRDLLQSAQMFKSPEAAIWEYVANALEYVTPSTRPEVHVHIERGRKVTITDNGTGMDLDGLQHYFTMHAENRERRRGRAGRGKFGTGKSAAFGIASKLTVSTVRGGVRNVVELTREHIENSSGGSIPITFKERNQRTEAPNGTVITIEKIFADSVKPANVIRTIERQLAFWRGTDPKVFVDTHQCAPLTPAIDSTHTFEPNDGERRYLGDVVLTIHTSTTPLDAGVCGVSVTTGPGALVAIATGGIEGKEFGSYLFGEIECPALESGDYAMAAYDASRSLELNIQHPVAARLMGFIGRNLDRVRQSLVEEHRKRRQEREFKELEREANKIAQLLNDDLSNFRDRYSEIAAARKRESAIASAGTAAAGDADGAVTQGDQSPGLLDPVRKDPTADREDKGGQPPDIGKNASKNDDGTNRVQPAGGSGGKKRPQGGLVVEYRNLGEDEDRGAYSVGEQAILINLDHPMVVAAKAVGQGIHDIAFTRVSYEIAFTRYALALTQELYNKDPGLDGSDILFEMRGALNRITRKAAGLYGDQ